MATLQKLRDKGSKLIVGAIGAALILFIVGGDIAKLFQDQPTYTAPTVGSVNGKTITLEEFNEFREKCEKYYLMVNNKSNLEDGDSEFITQFAWNQLVKEKTTTSQASKAGLDVTEEELNQYLSNINWAAWNNNVRMQQNDATIMPEILLTQNGMFNADVIDEIIELIDMYSEAPGMAQEIKRYSDILTAFDFIKTSVKCDIINMKVASMYNITSGIQNHAVAKSNFERDNNSYSIEVAAYPYSSLSNDQVNISDSEIKDYYNANKQLYRIPTDFYDVVYINQEVKPGIAELSALSTEFNGYAEQLKNGEASINDISFYASSEIKHDGFLWTENSGRFSDTHLEEIKKYNSGEVGEPFANWNNNTYNLVYVAKKEMVSDSIKFRFISINSESVDTVNQTTDKLLAELNNRAKFEEIAKNYPADTINFSTKDFNIGFFGINADGTPVATRELQEKIYNAKKNAYEVLDLNPNTKLIIQVIEKKGEVAAYDAFIIQRKMHINDETYNVAYDKLNHIISESNNVEEFAKNAGSQATYCQLNANSVNINNNVGTRELLRWVLRGNTGKISQILDYNIGNKKYLMTVAVMNKTPKGYVALENVTPVIKSELTNEKKGEIIVAQLEGKSFEELSSVENVVFNNEPITNVNYKKPTSVAVTNAIEPVISAAVTDMQVGDIKTVKGEKAVYVVKVISKEAKNNQFNSMEENYYINGQDFNFNYDPIQFATDANNNIVNKVYEHM